MLSSMSRTQIKCFNKICYKMSLLLKCHLNSLLAQLYQQLRVVVAILNEMSPENLSDPEVLGKENRYHSSHLQMGETEAQKDEKTCPHSFRTLELKSELQQRSFKFHFSACHYRIQCLVSRTCGKHATVPSNPLKRNDLSLLKQYFPLVKTFFQIY